MVKKSKQPEPKEANLSLSSMQASIPKLKRRIAELQAFDVTSVQKRSDVRISALSSKLDTLLTAIFGTGTVEYNRYHWGVTNLDTAGFNMMHETPMNEVHEGLQLGISEAIAQLQTILEGFVEEQEDAGRGVSTKPLKAYEGLELHPQIEKACGTLFKSGHYSNAIEDAVKALNAIVRLNSGVDDKDGTSLMESVFSPKKPLLKFNDLADQSDLDEQKGFMMMFSGAVSGLRNPRAHKLIKDDPERTLEFIAYISLLAKLADSSRK